MIHLNISLTSLAAILWSGMLIIAGSIWVLSSQVRKLVDLLEERGRAGDREAPAVRRAPGGPRVAARGSANRASSRAN